MPEKTVKVKFTRPADGKVVEAEIPESMLGYVDTMNSASQQVNSKFNMFDMSATGANFNELNPINTTAGTASGGFKADYAFPDANMATTYQTDAYDPSSNPYLFNAGYADKAAQDEVFNATYTINKYLADNGYGELVSPDYRYGARHIVTAEYQRPQVTIEPEKKQYTGSGTNVVRTQQTYNTGAKKEVVKQLPNGQWVKTFEDNPNANVTGEQNTFGVDNTQGVDVYGYTNEGGQLARGTGYDAQGKATNKTEIVQGSQGVKQDVVNTQQANYTPTGNNPTGLVFNASTGAWEEWKPTLPQTSGNESSISWPTSYPFGGMINQGVTSAAKALGVNDKIANVIGSGVATATGLIPGMQDNLFQAGDLLSDATQFTDNKKLQTAGALVKSGSEIASAFVDPAELAEGNLKLSFPDGGTLPRVNALPATAVYNHMPAPVGPTPITEEEAMQMSLNGTSVDELNPIWKGKHYVNYNQNQSDFVSWLKNVKFGIKDTLSPSKVSGIKFAQGGPITTYDTGGTHEENPLGGIPVGQDALVEEGETRWQDYIFSDRIKVPGKKETFAQASKRIEKKFEDRPHDKYSNQTKDELMKALMIHQEKLRVAAHEKVMKAYGGSVKKYDGTGMFPNTVNNTKDGYTPSEAFYSGNISDTLLSDLPNAQSQSQNPFEFNNKLSTGEYVAAFAPAAIGLGIGLSGAANTSFERVNPDLVNYDPQRQGIRQQGATARGSLNQNVRQNATSSGQALSNMVAGNVGIMDSMNNALGQSYMNEANTNAQIQNQANLSNANISMQETIANEQNKARQQDTIIAALNSAANSYLGLKKDSRAFEANNTFNNQFLKAASTQEYLWDPTTGVKYKNPNFNG
jgi:hypothetical protein